MKVSVIIPVYNAAAFVEQAVTSALAQPETGEVLLIEDGSPDNALEVCQQLEKSCDAVVLLRHPDGGNRGAGASRNLGIQHARHDHIAFLDADDVYLPGRFTAAAKIFAQDVGIDGVYGATGVFFDSDAARRIWTGLKGDHTMTTIAGHIDPEQLFYWLTMGGKGTFTTDAITAKRSLFEKTGPFDEHLPLHQDTAMWIKMAAVGRLAGSDLGKPVALRRVHANNRILNIAEHKNRYKPMLDDTLLAWAREKQLAPEHIRILRYRRWHNRLYTFEQWDELKKSIAHQSRGHQRVRKLLFIVRRLFSNPGLLVSPCILTYAVRSLKEFSQAKQSSS